MTELDDLTRLMNALAERLRRARATPGRTGTPDAGELAALQTRLAGLWTAIRAARAQTPPALPYTPTRPKWG